MSGSDREIVTCKEAKSCRIHDQTSINQQGFYLAGILSVLNHLLVISFWFPTADEGFKIIQQLAQSTTIILPPGPLLQQVQP